MNVVLPGRRTREGNRLLRFTTVRRSSRKSSRLETVRSISTHGTGCAFSSSLADSWIRDVAALKQYFFRRPMSPRRLRMRTAGKRGGPVNHLYRMNRLAALLPGSEAETAHSETDEWKGCDYREFFRRTAGYEGSDPASSHSMPPDCTACQSSIVAVMKITPTPMAPKKTGRQRQMR